MLPQEDVNLWCCPENIQGSWRVLLDHPTYCNALRAKRHHDQSPNSRVYRVIALPFSLSCLSCSLHFRTVFCTATCMSCCGRLKTGIMRCYSKKLLRFMSSLSVWKPGLFLHAFFLTWQKLSLGAGGANDMFF